jgi:hypothetical protein
MTDRVIVLHPNEALSFVADACAALADIVNEIHVSRPGDTELTNVYTEMVRAYAHLLRPALADQPDMKTRLAVIDHLLDRLHQAQQGEILTPVLDVTDRLHAELTREMATT